jgi:hexosaminidase
VPFLVPGVKRWHNRPGAFRAPRRMDVVVARGAGDRVLAVADRLARDLRARGRRSRVRSGHASEGDVVLRRRRGGQARGPRHPEAYRIGIGDRVDLEARTPTGLYWSTRTLLQWLDRGEGTLRRGVGLDWPTYSERALMIDAGRKFFPVPWLRARIREMSDLKMNLLHLHLSDDQGWRLESSASPRIHSEQGFITRAEMRGLVEYAAARHVTIMPEFDVPGHLLAGLRNYPELQLRNAVGEPNPRKLDYTLPAAKRWVLDRYREYLPLFPGGQWHLGGDEFLNPVEAATYPQLAAYASERAGSGASYQDGAVAFLQDLDRHLRPRGKRSRLWNDGLAGARTVRLDRGIGVDWWTDVSPLGDPTAIVAPQDLAADGYTVHNCSYYPLYFAYRAARQPQPGLEPFYEGWNPLLFRGSLYATDDVAAPYYAVPRAAVPGPKLHMWLDEPETATVGQVAADLAPRLAITAERAWNQTSRVAVYEEFAAGQR